MKKIRFTKTLAFRIAFPVVTILLITLSLLYILVLENISEFAFKTLETHVQETKEELYKFCDEATSMLIKEGRYDRDRIAIAKTKVLEKIKKFLYDSDHKGFIREEDRIIFISEDLKEKDISEIRTAEKLVVKKLENKKYYISSIYFQPWKWEIFLFEEEKHYKNLQKKVFLSYGITGIIMVGAIIFLLYLLHLNINKPIYNIIKGLKTGELYAYRGIEEIEFLSKTIIEHVTSLKNETVLLDNIYHIAITRRGEEFFDETVFTINRLYGLNCLIAKLSPDGEHADVVSLLFNNELKKGFRINLIGTPCEDVMKKKHMCVIEKGASIEYPQAWLLTLSRAESFIGLGIFNRKNEIVGIMNAFGRQREFSEVDIKAFQTIGQIVAIEFERIEEEKEKEKIREQLFQAQKMEAIGTLAGGIAHDFNNMLQAILGYASLLKMNTPKEHPSYNALEVIEKTSIRAAELTKQLLGYARKGKYIVEILNINDLVQDVYKIISRTFERNIEIKLNLNEKGLLIEGDRSQLTNVILNLCVNSRDAMPEGGLLTIETFEKKIKPDELLHHDARPIKYAALSVTDTGTGMDEETMKHIFEPFFTTKEVGKGTGMGLAMAYGVIQNHGGFITVESSPKKGSQFIIYLPLLEGELKEGVKEMGEFTQPEKSKGRILIIEDEKSIRSFTRKTLEEIGYEVFEASDGLEAIEIYRRERGNLDLVILDLILPRLNGLEVFKKIKELNPEQKIIISTGYGLRSHLEELLGQDVAAFLEKPYTYITLTTALKEALYGYKLDDD
ncbi:MAG: response regulator [Thermodesulfovibrionales bacterium]|nr:response regulator [Thermodesulfovibrionales bacterium]